MTTTVAIQGTCVERFRAVKEAFEQNFIDHGEIGASVAVTVDGKPVVDLWGGHADAARSRPWDRDTIVNVYSTTKGMTAICANRLIGQGKLDPDAPVAKYWPEFAQAGKENLPVRYLLSHRAGLPALRDFLALGGAYDWEMFTGALAATQPWWEPGTRHGYHAVTFGHLIGEVIRRITGMSVGTYFRKEIAEPLGVDFMIGFGPEHDALTADMIPAPFPTLDSDNMLAKVLADPTSMSYKAFMIMPDIMVNPDYMNTREWRSAEIPAANGHTNARALARVYGALARGGELDGVRLMSKSSVDQATEEQSYGEDAVLFMPTRFGLGFMLDVPEMRVSPTGTLFGHAGMGGSFGFADPEVKLGFGYAMNKMVFSEDLVDPRWVQMIAAVYGAL